MPNPVKLAASVTEETLGRARLHNSRDFDNSPRGVSSPASADKAGMIKQPPSLTAAHATAPEPEAEDDPEGLVPSSASAPGSSGAGAPSGIPKAKECID